MKTLFLKKLREKVSRKPISQLCQIKIFLQVEEILVTRN
jgi:hypothetical protein